MTNFPSGKYGCILADPPWSWGNSVRAQKLSASHARGRGPEKHYKTMLPADISSMPVSSLAEEDCALFMWATAPKLPQALSTMTAWGFKFSTTAFVWIKTTKEGKPHTGCGWWTRQNAEFVLLGTRGNPKRLARNVHSVLLSPRGRHSAKPDEIHNRIQSLVKGPYLELFARKPFQGWDCWGDELETLG